MLEVQPPLVFRSQHLVTFGQVDGAGLVFYPRYFEMVSNTVEAWFADALKTPFHALHLEQKLGVPTVATVSEFPAPSRLGETLVIDLKVDEIGTTSLKLKLIAKVETSTRFIVQATLVLVDLTTMKPVSWPENLREPMRRYLIMNSVNSID
jgi:4-hydroxybenzoyl-CoA thioesterase